MAAREQLIQEIEQVSDLLVEEVLDYLLFVKQRQEQKNLVSAEAESHLPKPSVLDRMGGVPKHLLAVGSLSDRDVRRKVIALRLQQSQQQL